MASHPVQRADDETAASGQAATLDAEAIRLAELVTTVKRLAASMPCDPCALRSALVALADSGLSDRTLIDGETFVVSALKAACEHRAGAVVQAAVLRVAAALSHAAQNFDTGSAGISLGDQFAALVDLMRTNPAMLSVQTDCFFALANYLSLNAEFTREDARAGAFSMSFIALMDALMEHGAALVSAAAPALNCVMLSATTFLSARLVTEFEDFAGTLDAVALVVALSRDAGAVKIALEALSFGYCDGYEALLALEPAKVELLASSSVLYASLEHCLAHHAADRGVILSLLNTLTSLAAVSYHRLKDHLRDADVSLAISKLIVRIVVTNPGDQEVQVLGCAGLDILCLGCGYPQCPSQLNASSLQSAITAGAAVPVAAALRSHHCDEVLFAAATRLLSRFFSSGDVDAAPFTDLVQVCVEALDRWVLDPKVTTARAGTLGNGAVLLGFMFAHSLECRALGRRAGAAKTFAAVHGILEQRTDLPDYYKTIVLRALQQMNAEESATLQSNLPSAGAGRQN